MQNNISGLGDIMKVAARVRVKIVLYCYDCSVLNAGERDVTANKTESPGDQDPSAV